MSWHSLPMFVRLAGRPVILLGEGEAADAKRRLLERAGAMVVGEQSQAALAIVAIDDEAAAVAAVERLKARGVLVNAVDRPALCDFTLPAIVDRAPVLVAIGTGGASAGLAAALRQRLEALLPPSIATLAADLFAARVQMRTAWPDASHRRRALARALSPGGQLDPLGAEGNVGRWLDTQGSEPASELYLLHPRSTDPDELTLRDARMLAMADRVYHPTGAPPALLNRTRADAERITGAAPHPLPPGLSVQLELPA